MKNRGQSLISALAGAAVLGVLLGAFISFFKMQMNASRKISSLGGVTSLSQALDTFLGSALCSGTGGYTNGGVTATVALGGPAPGYTLAIDTIQFPTGAIAVTTLANPTIANMIRPYSIGAITMTGLGGNGPIPGGGGNQYPFQMLVTFSSPTGPPPLPLTKFITVYTNPANLVVGACNSITQTPVPPNCPPGTYMQGIAADGNPVCVPLPAPPAPYVPPGGSGNCPAGQYATGFDVQTNTPQCTSFPAGSAPCPAGYFATGFNVKTNTPQCNPPNIVTVYGNLVVQGNQNSPINAKCPNQQLPPGWVNVNGVWEVFPAGSSVLTTDTSQSPWQPLHWIGTASCTPPSTPAGSWLVVGGGGQCQINEGGNMLASYPSNSYTWYVDCCSNYNTQWGTTVAPNFMFANCLQIGP